MTEIEVKTIMTLIVGREETAYNRLRKSPAYLELCARQGKTDETVEKLYQRRFTHEERHSIRCHYEGETEKNAMEVHEVYYQGLRNCFRLIIHLGLLGE